MGQARLEDLAREVKITCVQGARLPWEKQDEWRRSARGYTCTLSYRGRRMTVDFWMGRGLDHEPSSWEVLTAMLSDASSYDSASGLEDWASDMGFDLDSREALRRAAKLYRDVERQTERLKKLLGDDYETFLYAKN